MALIFDGGNTTSLNPVDIFGKIWLVEVEDLVILMIILNNLRYVESKDGLVLFVCPVGELVVAEFKILGSIGVVIFDKPVVVFESL